MSPEARDCISFMFDKIIKTEKKNNGKIDGKDYYDMLECMDCFKKALSNKKDFELKEYSYVKNFYETCGMFLSSVDQKAIFSKQPKYNCNISQIRSRLGNLIRLLIKDR